MIQDALIHKSILLLKRCRLFGVQDKNTNTWCNPTLYRQGARPQVKPGGTYWPYAGHG